MYSVHSAAMIAVPAGKVKNKIITILAPRSTGTVQVRVNHVEKSCWPAVNYFFFTPELSHTVQRCTPGAQY